MGASTSWNPQGLSRDCFTFLLTLLLLLATFFIPQELGRFLTQNGIFILEICRQISLGATAKSIAKMFASHLINNTYTVFISVPLMIIPGSEQGYYSGGKVKEIPLQAWAGPGVSRWLRLPDFKPIGT